MASRVEIVAQGVGCMAASVFVAVCVVPLEFTFQSVASIIGLSFVSFVVGGLILGVSMSLWCSLPTSWDVAERLATSRHAFWLVKVPYRDVRCGLVRNPECPEPILRRVSEVYRPQGGRSWDNTTMYIKKYKPQAVKSAIESSDLCSSCKAAANTIRVGNPNLWFSELATVTVSQTGCSSCRQLI